MAREFGKLWFSLFADEHFCAQPILDKLIFTVLLGQPAFNYAGWSPIQLRKWAKGCQPASDMEIKAALIRLERNRYVYTDSHTEEVLIRSFIRNDRVEKQPNLLINALGSAAVLESPKLAAVLLTELDRVTVPETSSAKIAAGMVMAMTKARTRLGELSKGIREPFAEPFAEDFPEGLNPEGARPAETVPSAEGLPEGLPKPPVVVAVEVLNSPNAVVEFKDQESERASRARRKRPATRLSGDWTPTDQHKRTAAARGLNLEQEATKFRLHAEENDRRAVVWNAAFSRWLENARPRTSNSGKDETGRIWQD